MSKAFTREDDESEDELDEAQSALPAGFKNYMTPAGFARLQEELRQLRQVERPEVVKIVSWAAGNGDRSENGDYLYGKRRLREIDRRVRFLVRRLESASVVDPALQKNREQIFFGATVTYANGRDEEVKVRIVGVDEAGFEPHYISWIAPVARALLKARVGDTVQVRTPGGVEPLEVLDIAYDT